MFRCINIPKAFLSAKHFAAVLSSRVPQLTCTWMSGASGLGNLTTWYPWYHLGVGLCCGPFLNIFFFRWEVKQSIRVKDSHAHAALIDIRSLFVGIELQFGGGSNRQSRAYWLRKTEILWFLLFWKWLLVRGIFWL